MLIFADYPSQEKTAIFSVAPASDAENIMGWIQWCGAYRSYAFFPSEGTAWNEECIKEIYGFIGKQMHKLKAHKQEKTQAKNIRK